MKTKLAVLALVVSLLLVMLAFPLAGLTQGEPSGFDSPLPVPTVEGATKFSSTAAAYAAERYDLPPSAIYTGYEEPLAFPVTQREVIVVPVFKVNEALPDPYRIFIDAKTGDVIENLDSLYEAERKAYDAKYGKLAPGLYDRLEATDSNVSVPVAVWLVTPNLSEVAADLIAETDARYPEVDHEQTAADEWRTAYLEGLSDYMGRVTSPVVLSLAAEGIVAEAIAGMPLLTATLTKEQIYEVAQRVDVETIYADDGVAEPALDVSVPSERVRPVWMRRISPSATLSGAGVAIAILESFNLYGSVRDCLNIGETLVAATPTPRPAPTPTRDPNHKNKVSAAAGCDDVTLRGPGFGATIVDAAHSGNESNAIQALTWVVATPTVQRADIVNQSEQYYESDRTIHLLDRAYDYWVFQGRITAIVAAGNQGEGTTYVTTPGRAYNVITVGNASDAATLSWSDDTRTGSSSWLNPSSSVEKPELMAYGNDINTVAGQAFGTSFAAPQVSGITALLLERDAALKMWPSAVKAILMASAVHNVAGGSLPNPAVDDEDGAGAIDAALADTIAQNHAATSATTCDRPCYWTTETSQLPFGQHVYYIDELDALQGEHIRVAIAWLAHGDQINRTILPLSDPTLTYT